MSEQKQDLKNIAGTILIDATAAFLNGAGLGAGEDKNKVIPKTFRERVSGKLEEVPYVSAQSWRRWLRDTVNEENHWTPSELHAIDVSAKGSTNKIATFLNPIDYPEDDIFGYMKAGKNYSAKGKSDDDDDDENSTDKQDKKSNNSESVQRTSAFKTSILKGIKGKRSINEDEAFVHLKEGTPLPYSTKFYSTHLEGFFNLEYYRLGVFENLGSKQELSSETLKENLEKLDKSKIYGGKFERYELKNSEKSRKERASGLLKGLARLRGGAKQSAFGSDVSPKVIILAGMSCANPVFNDLFDGKGDKPALKIEALKEIAKDYQDKLATSIYIGIRTGYLENEEEIKQLSNFGFIVDSPVALVDKFISDNLKVS
jgi:CRISPR-associated protein Cst2